jgi:hypothetical protein
LQREDLVKTQAEEELYMGYTRQFAGPFRGKPSGSIEFTSQHDRDLFPYWQFQFPQRFPAEGFYLFFGVVFILSRHGCLLRYINTLLIVQENA